MKNYAKAFDLNRYVVIKGFYDNRDVQRMASRMDFLMSKGLLTQDPQCPLSYAIYSDSIHSEMQEKYRYRLSDTIGANLLPTYTYARIYSPREVLAWHSDRPSCEISVTSTLFYDTWSGKPWPIFVAARPGTKDACDSVIVDQTTGKSKIEHGIPIELELGDILVYRGCEVKHWREAFCGIKQTQVFIHHVDANGPFKDYKYDCRPSLGSSVHTKDEAKTSQLNAMHDNNSKMTTVEGVKQDGMPYVQVIR